LVPKVKHRRSFFYLSDSKSLGCFPPFVIFTFGIQRPPLFCELFPPPEFYDHPRMSRYLFSFRVPSCFLFKPRSFLLPDVKSEVSDTLSTFFYHERISASCALFSLGIHVRSKAQIPALVPTNCLKFQQFSELRESRSIALSPKPNRPVFVSTRLVILFYRKQGLPRL